MKLDINCFFDNDLYEYVKIMVIILLIVVEDMIHLLGNVHNFFVSKKIYDLRTLLY